MGQSSSGTGVGLDEQESRRKAPGKFIDPLPRPLLAVHAGDCCRNTMVSCSRHQLELHDATASITELVLPWRQRKSKLENKSTVSIVQDISSSSCFPNASCPSFRWEGGGGLESSRLIKQPLELWLLGVCFFLPYHLCVDAYRR